MSRSFTHNINHLISAPKDEVKTLLDRLTKIQTLNNTLHDKLNATLSKNCRVINIRQNILVIATTSPAWANKIRFQLPDLLVYFREKGYYGLANIEVIVQPK